MCNWLVDPSTDAYRALDHQSLYSLYGRYRPQHTTSRAPRSQSQLLVNTCKDLQHSHDQLVTCSKGAFFAHSFLLRCLLYPSQVLIFSQPSSSLFEYCTHPFLSFFLPHCCPWFSCFHSLGENTHLASNHCHSLVDSQIANFILPYLISQILFRTKSCFLYRLCITIP